MAGELLLVNPRRRRGRKRRASVSRRRRRKVTVLARNPRRRRRRGMSALQRRYFGGGKRRHRRRKSPSILNVASNPRRRRRRSRFTVMRRNPSPISNPVGYFSEAAIPAVSGAIGGIAIDYLFANYVPPNFQYGMTGVIARLGAAALLGMGVGAVTSKRTGALVAGGAMTITVYDVAVSYLQQSSGGQGQGNMGRYVRMNGVRRFGRMKGNRRMGYWNPARTSGMGRYVAMNRYAHN